MMERICIKDKLPDSFFALPQSIYHSLPFAPEEDREPIHRLLSEESAHHEMVLYTDHQTVRLLGIFPENAPVAHFAYWEASNQKTNQQAFEMFETDAAQRKMKLIQGPLTFNTFHRYRLRLQTPSWHMFDREPVNPLYYIDWLKELQYTPSLTFESRRIKSSGVPEVYAAKDHYISTLTQLPFRCIPLTPENWVQRAHEIFELVDTIFSQNPGYKPISYAQFCLLYNADFAQKLCPHSSVLFENESKKLVGLCFCLPDYRSLAQKANPVFARDYSKLTHKTLLIKSVGVHPDFRGQGLMNYLGAYCMQTFRNHYDDAIFCLMRENNPSLAFTENLPYESCSYALFEKAVRL